MQKLWWIKWDVTESDQRRGRQKERKSIEMQIVNTNTTKAKTILHQSSGLIRFPFIVGFFIHHFSSSFIFGNDWIFLYDQSYTQTEKVLFYHHKKSFRFLEFRWWNKRADILYILCRLASKPIRAQISFVHLSSSFHLSLSSFSSSLCLFSRLHF